MKNYFIILIALITTFTQAQNVNIPDANFKNALVNDIVVDTNGDGILDSDADTNNDGEIQVSEAEDVLWLNVSSKNIFSLEGIQSFVNLERLELFGNELTSLDLSQNTNIEYLECGFNEITNLDFSQNINLSSLFCVHNQLSNINITQNTALISLYCSINQLTGLDVSQNPNLEFLRCVSNQLTIIDTSQNPNLQDFYCGNNLLESLDVTQNINLKALGFPLNQLNSIDLTQNTSLTYLGCPENQMESLYLNQNTNLEILWCYDNLLTSLDLSQNTNLESLGSYNNQLTSLNIKNGNNVNTHTMWTYGNSNLFCIEVDDETATYPACVTNTNGWCIDNFTQYSEDCILSTDDITTSTFNIYPNPTRNILNINTTGQIETIKIFSLQGQLIKEISTSIIDVSILTTGLYFAQVTIDGKTSVKKFLKL